MSKPSEKELRELDATIAEMVFGLPVNWEDGRRKHGPGFFWHDKSKTVCGILKHYTTDRAAAMEVLEKCCKKMNPVSMKIWKSDKPFHCGLAETWGSAETLPLAICLFAKSLHEKK